MSEVQTTAEPAVEMPRSTGVRPFATRLGQRLDDLMNPIAVKEMRQAVAGRLIVGMVILFLLVQTVVVAIYMLDHSTVGQQGTTYGDGPGLFMIVMMILLGTCILFVPATTAYRLSAERGDEHVDLMYITTLRPWRIITGKFASAAVVTLLIYALCLPYITLAYLLRGIDLVSIATVLGMNLLVIGWCVMLAIFVACLPKSRPAGMLLQLLTLGVFVATYFMSVRIAWEVMEGWLVFELEWILAAGGIYVGMTLLLFTLATAAISPPASNRALLPRAAFVAVWVVLGVALAFAVPYDGVEIWAFLSIMALSLGLLAAVGERDVLNPRLAAKVPRNRLLRVPAFLFYSGAANGIVWTLVLMATTLLVAHAAIGGNQARELEAWAWLCVAYALGGFMLARRTPLSRWVAPQHTFAIVLMLVTLGAIWPVFGAMMQGNLYVDRIPAGWWVTSIFATMWGYTLQSDMAVTAGRFALVAMLLASAPWLWRRVTAFHPPAGEGEAEQAPAAVPGAPAEVSEETGRG